MCKYKTLITVAALFLAQQSFANMSMKMDDEGSIKECEKIVDMCKKAGYTRDGGPGKGLWRDCLKPIVLGKTVTDVNVDPKDVQTCRDMKIQRMQQKIDELKSAAGQSNKY